MKISGAHLLAVPLERAYALLQDPVVLGKSMPGCDALVQIGESQYHMKMKMVMASISGLFDGTVRIADQNPPSSFRLIVEGSGKIGFMKGDGLLTLVPLEGGTNVQYQFWVYNQNAIPMWSRLPAYSAQNILTWTPTITGNYLFSVTALDSTTGTQVNTTTWYTIQ